MARFLQPHSPGVNRRGFLKATGVSTAALAAGGFFSQRSPAASKSSLEKLNIAIIGTANRGADNIAGVQQESLVALCDIDANYLEKAAARFPGARRYVDYREMLDREGDAVDAVMVSTADHHHAPATLRAIRSGRHVYCEKPLAHTVEEVRLITEAAREKRVATQLGTIIHAEENYRRAVEIVQHGTIGEINEVHVWVGKGWDGGDRPTRDETPPASMNWDLWLGPAPVRPFVGGLYHPAQWRRFWDFGNGTLGDMGCHYMDLAFWALDLKYPTRCTAAGPPPNANGCPTGLTAQYEFPRATGSPLKLTWYDGTSTPSEVSGHRVPSAGVMFCGTDGELFADYTSHRLFPTDKFADFQLPAHTIPRSIGHFREWIEACKTGTPTTCNFDYSGPLTETVLLGTVAYRQGVPLEWDATQLKATNCPEADRLIRKAYRDGWQIT